MKRRSFIKKTALGIPFTLGGFHLSAGNKDWNWLSNVASDNILVLVQLNGGNDGLNTFVPMDQYHNLVKARENILIPEANLLSIERVDDLMFHPSLAEFTTVWNNEKMGIIQNVGYPNPNKSHFRSTDIWTSASDSDVIESTGWLGRYLQNEHPSYPDNYPNETFNSPLALTIDTLVSSTCQGPAVNLSFAQKNLNSFSNLESSDSEDIPDGIYGDELSYIIESIEKSNAYGGVIQEAAEKGVNASEKYTTSKLSEQLKVVANLISGGLGTKIYIVKLGGFDTHDSQVDENSVLLGRHAELLRDLSVSMDAFLDDLTQQGKSEHVVAMTFSEFGRRTESNASFGTDHGEAAPIMLFGDKVQPIIHGENPEIPDDTFRHNLEMKIDFRSVYGSLLMDLFDLDESSARAIVHPNFEYISLLKKGQNFTEDPLGSDNMKKTNLLGSYPNPGVGSATIRFTTRGLPMRLELIDDKGRTIKVLVDKRLKKGQHEMNVNLEGLAAGIYFYRLQEGMVNITQKIRKK